MKITTSLLQAFQVRGDAGHELAVSANQGLRMSCLRPDEEPGKVIPSPPPHIPAQSLRTGIGGKACLIASVLPWSWGVGLGKLQANAEGQVAHSVLKRKVPLLSWGRFIWGWPGNEVARTPSEGEEASVWLQ